MVISRREKILIFILLVVVLAFVSGRFFLLPQHWKIQELRAQKQQLEDLKATLVYASEQQETLEPEQEEQLASRAEELAALQAMVPGELELLPLLQFIQEATSQENLPILNLDYKEKKTNKDKDQDQAGEPEEVELHLVTAGSVNALTLFMERLTNGPRLVTIHNAQVTARKKEQTEADKTEEKTSSPAAGDNLQVPSYYIPPPQVPEAMGQRLPVVVLEPAAEAPAPTKETETREPEKKQADDIVRGSYQLDLKLKAYYLQQDDQTREQENPDSNNGPES